MVRGWGVGNEGEWLETEFFVFWNRREEASWSGMSAGTEKEIVISIWKEGAFLAVVVVVRGEEKVVSVGGEEERLVEGWMEFASLGDHSAEILSRSIGCVCLIVRG